MFSIGITGYLDQFANMEDLQLFYADQRPDALNSSFKVVSVNGDKKYFFSWCHNCSDGVCELSGGMNNQTLSAAGAEADLDVQFAFGLTFPTPGTFWTTAGSPPFVPDALTPTDTNEPYTEVSSS